MDLDRFFRRIWLVNGVLALLLLMIALGVAGYGLLSERWNRREQGVRPGSNAAPPAADLRPRAIRYDVPERILNSDWTLVQVGYGTDYGKGGSGSLAVTSRAYGVYGREGVLVNVAFLPPDGGPGRLLLDRPAYIRTLDFPRVPNRQDEPVDSVPWITYSIAFDDSDRNGRLDEEDAAELYVSDLDGSNFRRVLPPGLRVRSTEVRPDRSLLVLALDGRGAERRPEDQLPQRAFRFDPRTGRLSADGALDSLAATAGRILGRP